MNKLEQINSILTIFASLISILVFVYTAFKRIYNWLNTPTIIYGIHDFYTKDLTITEIYYYIHFKYPWFTYSSKSKSTNITILFEPLLGSHNDYDIEITNFISRCSAQNKITFISKEILDKQSKMTFIALPNHYYRIKVTAKICSGVVLNNYNLNIITNSSNIKIKEKINFPIKNFLQ